MIQDTRSTGIPQDTESTHSHPSRLSAQLMRERFGPAGPVYEHALKELGRLWKQVQNHPQAEAGFAAWSSDMTTMHRRDLEVKHFLDHTYLSLLGKAVAYRAFSRHPRRQEAGLVLSNQYFQHMEHLAPQDCSLWLAQPVIEEDASALLWMLCDAMGSPDWPEVDEDIFRELYQDVIAPPQRHRAGEYYTPEWLVQLVLTQVLSLWDDGQPEGAPSLFDPTCGSGTFLFRAIRTLLSNGADPQEISNRVHGLDINPLAVWTSQVNYLLALGGALQELETISVPVRRGDCLKPQGLAEPGGSTGTYDIVVGNPPWSVMRFIEDPTYQDFLKQEALRVHLLGRTDIHLFSHMELATLFFQRCADAYLRDGGLVAFVMPRSVIAGTLHHRNFRKFAHPRMELLQVIDLEQTSPLFAVPCCVLIAQKGGTTRYPVPCEKISGRLSGDNLSIAEAASHLSRAWGPYRPPELSGQPSPYYERFRAGASIFPRALYFVDAGASSDSTVPVETSPDIARMAKDPWKERLQGCVERQFLFFTLLAWEIFPFGFVRLRSVVLPIEEVAGRGYDIIDPEDLDRRGCSGTAAWVRRTQQLWLEKRTQKSAQRFPTLADRLDYHRLLTAQGQNSRYAVLYNATGGNVASCVLDRAALSDLGIHAGRLVIDVKTWFCKTTTAAEAYYLCAVLNSQLLNDKIKPLQPKGLYGARAINRRPLLFPIPLYADEDARHRELADIARTAHENARALGLAARSNPRAEARERFRQELRRIDSLVADLLSEAE